MKPSKYKDSTNRPDRNTEDPLVLGKYESSGNTLTKEFLNAVAYFYYAYRNKPNKINCQLSLPSKSYDNQPLAIKYWMRSQEVFLEKSLPKNYNLWTVEVKYKISNKYDITFGF